MGHRIEPCVSIPTKLQTDSTGYTLESVIHIGCTFPSMTIIESGNLPDRPFFMSIQKRGVPLYVYKKWSSFREGESEREFGEFCAWFHEDI